MAISISHDDVVEIEDTCNWGEGLDYEEDSACFTDIQGSLEKDDIVTVGDKRYKITKVKEGGVYEWEEIVSRPSIELKESYSMGIYIDYASRNIKFEDREYGFEEVVSLLRDKILLVMENMTVSNMVKLMRRGRLLSIL